MTQATRLRTSLRRAIAAAALVAALPSLAACSSSDALQAQVSATSEAPLFDQSIADIRSGVDARMEAGVPVPVPVDAGGGYTHEQHKQNGKT
ncbi:MAG: heparinase, partial [Pseudomonadota bacterium]